MYEYRLYFLSLDICSPLNCILAFRVYLTERLKNLSNYYKIQSCHIWVCAQVSRHSQFNFKYLSIIIY